MNAPFPFFGGKREVAAEVWRRFGRPKQYIEPFCGSAAVLLSAPQPASLEVIGDANGFIANFWRATVHQPLEVARHADYPVSHVDLGARHGWLMQQRERIGAALADPHWRGDAQVAGWWLWGQCCWIGSGWCEWDGKEAGSVSDAGRGVQAVGKVPHVSDAGRGVQAVGRVPHVSDAGRGVQAVGRVPHVSDAGRGVQFWTSGGETAARWLGKLARRLERVRVVHGEWSRCLNNHYGGAETAVFLDPPYENFEGVYRAATVAQAAAAWALENADLRVAICGLAEDYDLPGWTLYRWSRKRLTFGSSKTTDNEAIWFSPACLGAQQATMFQAM